MTICGRFLCGFVVMHQDMVVAEKATLLGHSPDFSYIMKLWRINILLISTVIKIAKHFI